MELDRFEGASHDRAGRDGDELAASLAVNIASFIATFNSSALNVALPSIGKEMGADAITMGWVVNGFLLASTALLMPLGRLADIAGRKRAFIAGLSIFALSSALSAISNSAWALVASRALQGVGGAMIFATSVAILASVFPAGRRGRAIGAYSSATYLGLSTGPFLGGLLTERLGWRSVFLLNVPVCSLVALATMRRVRGEWAEARGEGFDLIGSALYAVPLALAMFGISSLPSASAAIPISIGVAGLAAFAFREARVEHPILDVALFRRNAAFALSNIAALINYSATFGIGFLMSLYLQFIRGLDPQTAGLILVSQPAAQAALSPMAGRLSDRTEPRFVASAGMALTALGLAALSLSGEGTDLRIITAELSLIGLGFALFITPNTAAIMGSVEPRFFGMASSTLATMRLAGQTMSIAIAMIALSAQIGGAKIAPGNYTSLLTGVRVALMMFSALCAAGIIASLVRGRGEALDGGGAKGELKK